PRQREPDVLRRQPSGADGEPNEPRSVELLDALQELVPDVERRGNPLSSMTVQLEGADYGIVVPCRPVVSPVNIERHIELVVELLVNLDEHAERIKHGYGVEDGLRLADGLPLGTMIDIILAIPPRCPLALAAEQALKVG